MRNLMKLFAVMLFVVVTASTNAQTLKFGHIDLNALIQVMPERATAAIEFENFQADIEEIYDGMNQEFQQKYSEFEQLSATASDVIREAKIAEVQDLQQRLQNYQQSATQQLQEKETEIMQPIYEKAQNTVAEVAKENELIYVFEASSVLYKSNQSLDLLPLVKAKLGIQ